MNGEKISRGRRNNGLLPWSVLLKPGQRAARIRRGLSRRPARAAGFTLIELMVVLVIISILGAVAYNSYRASVVKSRRSDGRALLAVAAARQQEYFAQNDTFTTSASDLDMSSSSPFAYYQLTMATGHTGNIASSYKMTAVASSTGKQSDDTKCGNLTLDSLGRKGYTGSEDDGCWALD